MEQEIAKIKKFKLECKNCETQIIIDTHNSNKNKNVKVYFVCEEKEKR